MPLEGAAFAKVYTAYAPAEALVIDILHGLRRIESLFCAEAHHGFSASGVDWGFTSFMSLRDLLDPKKGFLAADDSLTVG